MNITLKERLHNDKVIVKKAIKEHEIDKDTIKDQLYKSFGCTDDDGIIGLELRQAFTSGCRSSSGSPISRAPIEIRAPMDQF